MATLEELSTLYRVNQRDILSRRVEPVGTELTVVEDALIAMRTVRIGERVFELSGMKRHHDLITKTIANYRQKWKTNLEPLAWAKADQVTIEPLRPEVFDLSTFLRTGLTAGTYNIIPTGSGTWDAVKDEEVVVITDLIEMNPDNVVTAIKVSVDGEDLNPEEIRTQIKASDIQIYELSYPLVCDLSLDIDGKVEQDGDAEITPMGVHIALGKQIPALTL